MQIDKSNLQKALEIVRPGLANKEIQEQVTSFAFLNGRVITYNDEISVSHPVEGLELEGTVIADRLYQLISKINTETIDISTKGNEILIKAGRSKAGLTIQQKIKLPLDEEIAQRSKWKRLPIDFIKYLKFAAVSCAKNMSQPLLTCIHVSPTGIIEANDSFRITRCKLNEEMFVKDFLLPVSSAMHVIRLNPTRIAEGNGWIHFSTPEGTIMSCRIFEEDYMDCSQLIKVNGVSITLPKRIEKILDRASVFAKRDIFSDEIVIIHIKEEKITIQSEAESGWFEEDIKFVYEGEPISFKIKPYTLKDIFSETLDCIVGDTKLKFKGEGWIYIAVLEKLIKE